MQPEFRMPGHEDTSMITNVVSCVSCVSCVLCVLCFFHCFKLKQNKSCIHNQQWSRRTPGVRGGQSLNFGQFLWELVDGRQRRWLWWPTRVCKSVGVAGSLHLNIQSVVPKWKDSRQARVLDFVRFRCTCWRRMGSTGLQCNGWLPGEFNCNACFGKLRMLLFWILYIDTASERPVLLLDVAGSSKTRLVHWIEILQSAPLCKTFIACHNTQFDSQRTSVGVSIAFLDFRWIGFQVARHTSMVSESKRSFTSRCHGWHSCDHAPCYDANIAFGRKLVFSLGCQWFKLKKWLELWQCNFVPWPNFQIIDESC